MLFKPRPDESTNAGSSTPAEAQRTAPGANDNDDTLSPPPPYDHEWEQSMNQSLHHLQRQVTTYHEADESGRESVEAEAQRVADAMRDVGDSQPDPKVKGVWHRRAEEFIRATKSERRGLLKESHGIIGLLLSIPIILIGTALHVVGGTIRTAGVVVGRLGDVLMGCFVR